MNQRKILETIRKRAGRLWLGARRVFPITRLGFLLIAVAAATLWAQGFLHQDLVLLAGCLVLLATIAFLMLLVIGSTIVAWRCSRHPYGSTHTLQLETDVEQSTGFALEFPRWLPFISFRWQWVAPGAVEVRLAKNGSLLEENVTPRGRALTTAIERHFIVRDFLGLSEISWLRTEPAMLRILPVRMADSGLEPPLGFGAGEDAPDPWGALAGDRIEMREYQPGDSPRLVRWKTYARTGRLFVRTPERAVVERPSACVWLAGGEQTGIAARLARELLERGSFGDEFLFGAAGSARISEGDLELARDIIAESGASDAATYDGLAEFLGRASDAGFSDCLFFDATESNRRAECNKRMDELTRILMSSPIPVRPMICVERLSGGGVVEWWKRIVFRGDERPSLDGLRLRFTTLRDGGPSYVFEQTSGAFHAL